MALSHAYTIAYVDNVLDTVEFFEKALDLKRGFVHENNHYAEMKSTGTKLAFVSWDMMNQEMGSNWNRKDHAGFELTFATDDVKGYLDRAINEGATMVSKPQKKSWGQTVAYIRSPQGILVELCTFMPQEQIK